MVVGQGYALDPVLAQWQTEKRLSVSGHEPGTQSLACKTAEHTFKVYPSRYLPSAFSVTFTLAK